MNCIICPIETCENRGKDREVFCQTGEYAIRPHLAKELKWEDYRREAAKDFIAAMLSNVTPSAERWTTEDIVPAALEIADALIKQLREGER